MPEAGEQAPEFTLPDQGGREVKLSELRGKTVVLYSYPKADTTRSNRSNGRIRRPACVYVHSGVDMVLCPHGQRSSSIGREHVPA
jgi:peroxiredoxin Q/BCP